MLRSERRPGAYFDSIVLMRLQSALAGLEGVEDAGVVMATAANLALLESGGLLPPDTAASADDLLVVVRARTEAAAREALAQIDPLLARRRAEAGDDYRPHSLETAARRLPHASWVLVSVPGRYAAEVAGEALDLGRHVFLYSDNVPLAEEVELKRRAAASGLMVMGPDCGTAIVGGVGLGFANRVRRGAIGLVGASGTGLQAVMSRVHALGAGISHALGTGGRDLREEVGAATARQGLDLLARDPQTRVIVMVSKPPSPAVVANLLAAAERAEKPVVVDFIGHPTPVRQLGNLHFAASLGEAASLAVELAAQRRDDTVAILDPDAVEAPLVRGLFAGGTLAHEALLGLKSFLQPLASNLKVDGVEALADPGKSRGHTVLDLGDDEYTVGRLHPMMDQELRLRRMRQEAADRDVGAILLDVVLGDGAHPDPASELAPVIEEIRQERELEILVVVLGTDEDPQDMGAQIDRLRRAGARVFRDLGQAVAYLHRARRTELPGAPPVALECLASPLVAINVGLESFYDSLRAQDAAAVHVRWRPPAGGDEKLRALLRRMKRRGAEP